MLGRQGKGKSELPGSHLRWPVTLELARDIYVHCTVRNKGASLVFFLSSLYVQMSGLTLKYPRSCSCSLLWMVYLLVLIFRGQSLKSPNPDEYISISAVDRGRGVSRLEIQELSQA